MSDRRAFAWVAALALAAAVYVLSVIVTGQLVRNGAWLVLVLVFVFAGIDVAICAARGRR